MSNPDSLNFSVPLFRLPFRAMFLGAGFLSIWAMALWMLYWGQVIVFEPAHGFFWWHSHEMIFGFAGAVLVGFLLTAAKNWTGTPGVSGYKLVFLFILWLVARVSFSFANELVNQIGLLSEIGFWLASCVMYSEMIIKKKMWKNIVFSFVLLGLCALSVLSIPEMYSPWPSNKSMHGGIGLFLLSITIIGGRIIPFFTASATGTEKVEGKAIIEVLIGTFTVALFIWILLFGLLSRSPILGVLLSVLVVLNFIRFTQWPIRLALGNAMLWSLYLGYLFMILGLGLIAAYHFAWFNNLSAALHMVTIGGIGLMIFTMISRVSLGHTGRKIVASPRLIAGFIFISIAALIRSLLVEFDLGLAPQTIYFVSGALWIIAFLLWLSVFTSVLSSPRADGRPG